MTATDSENRWARLKAVFDAALDAPRGEREALVAAAGLGDGDLAELRSLLAHHDEATGEQGFLARPVVSLAPAEPAAQIGQRLGNWTLVRPLGAGGMGEVFEARRADGQYEGRAAVKLLKRGMDSAAVLQRFALERQALARLSHPGIARLLDAGASDEGLPYFVMEYVAGRPIDQAAQDLALEARLGLFLQLAEAVAHAHRNLLVHRDLKPGNVLVDETGQVKLLDFGIAKALAPEGGELDTTQAGAMTPNYASPEQVRGEPVSTATDVYSLGVLLYLLLTGLRPTGREATTPQEAARSVLEDEPTRPSRLSPDDVGDPQWLAQARTLQGDLDNIVLKALEKEPERRYASVDALAADLRAYRSGYPVSARAPTWGYRTAKLLARNRLASALGALGLVALLGGLAATTWQAREARLAQGLAEQRLAEVRRVTHDLVFGFGDSVEYLPGGQKIKLDLLRDTHAALERLLPTLGGDTAVVADMAQVQVRMAEALMPGYPGSLEKPDDARRHAQAAMALVAKAWPTQKGNALFATYASRAYNVMASAEQEAGRLEEAVKLTRQGLKLAEEGYSLAPPGVDRLRLLGAITASQFNLGLLLDDNGQGVNRPAEAMTAYEAARAGALAQLGMKAEIAAVNAGLRPEETRLEAELGQTQAVIAGSIASSRLRRGDYAGSAEARRENVEHLRRVQPMHPEQQQFWASLASTLFLQAGLELQLNRPAEALASMRESMDWTLRLLQKDADNPRWPGDRDARALTLGTALALTGASVEARPWLERTRAYWAAETAKAGNARNRRSLGLSELRLAGLRGDAKAMKAAAVALQALSDAEPKSADNALAAAEAAFMLADKPAACAAWDRAAPLRPLPPQALAWRAELGC
ncbi:serine/threonine-protein kinase [Roseateles sp. LYH14W]|uniref:Serine/threonine-protein kinase n=1 Tax=Pelomonas parva TaxID=3299032 RepID=A0ABW7FAY5_9BURK